MLLKKQEKDNLVKAIYSSSNICASTYDKSTKDLTIIFANGGQYKYSNVSVTDYTRFELADSQGNVMNSHIKNYTFEKLDKVDTKLILAEAETIKKAEDEIILNATIKNMVEAFRTVVTFYDSTTNLESKLLEKAKIAVNNYESLIQPKLDKVNG